MMGTNAFCFFLILLGCVFISFAFSFSVFLFYFRFFVSFCFSFFFLPRFFKLSIFLKILKELEGDNNNNNNCWGIGGVKLLKFLPLASCSGAGEKETHQQSMMGTNAFCSFFLILLGCAFISFAFSFFLSFLFLLFVSFCFSFCFFGQIFQNFNFP